MFTRNDYMQAYGGDNTKAQNAALHRLYYGQFVNRAIINYVVSVIGKDDLLASKDEHLNDIRLSRWDRMHQCLPFAPGVFHATQNGFYSLSDTVCTAKEAARQWLDEQQGIAKPSLYDEMKAAGLVTSTHHTDLYVRDCPHARAILAKHGKKPDGWNVQQFRDEVSGLASLDIPFAYPEGR